MPQIVDFNTENFYNNPWSTYAYLRASEPIYWSPDSHAYYLFKYKHVRQALLDSNFSVEHPFRATRQIFGPTILDIDGVSHQRIRSVAMTSFKPSIVDDYAKAIIEPVVKEVIEEILQMPNPDFVSNFAIPIPFRVICRILGIPEDKAMWLYNQMRPIVSYLDLQRPGSLTKALDTRNQLNDYLKEIIALHKATAMETFIGHLVQGHTSKKIVDEGEILRTSLLMVAAGTETSVSAIGNLFVCLLKHPDVLDAVQTDPGLIAGIVRETLRLEPPVSNALRFAKKDICIENIVIQRGMAVQLSLASANRDEEVFSDPEMWKPNRVEENLLSFGAGRHTCLGFILAQKELEIVLRCLFERIHVFAPEENTIPKIQGHLFRGPASLYLHFERK